MGKQKLKKIDEEDKYIALKEKLKLKKADKPATKTATKNTKLSYKLKRTTRAFAEKSKKHGLGTQVKGDENKIISGQEEATPHLHREGLSCAVEVPSTRGSHEGELLLRKKPP